MTLDEILALFPDNNTGEIDAADLRTAITEIATRIQELLGRVDVLEGTSNLLTFSAPWMYTNLAPPPTGNQVRLNNVNTSLATSAVFRLIDANSQDHSLEFSSGNIISFRLQDFNDSTTYAQYDVTGTPTIGVDDATFAVTFVKGNGVLPNQKALALFLVDTGP